MTREGGRLSTGQPEDRGRDVVRGRVAESHLALGVGPLHRHDLLEVRGGRSRLQALQLVHRLEDAVDALRLDRAREDGVDANATSTDPELSGEGQGEGVEPRLRHDVGEPPVVGRPGEDRRDVDDGAPRPEHGCGGAGHVPGSAEQIANRVEHGLALAEGGLVSVGERNLFQRSLGPGAAGVVHQNVQATEGLLRLAHRGAAGLRFGGVGGEGHHRLTREAAPRHLLDEGAKLVFVAPSHQYPRALAQKLNADVPADVSRRPGEDDGRPVESARPTHVSAPAEPVSIRRTSLPCRSASRIAHAR